ncbi:hypothetical protein ACU686_15590 [Yinghuangia aomiensis]
MEGQPRASHLRRTPPRRARAFSTSYLDTHHVDRRQHHPGTYAQHLLDEGLLEGGHRPRAWCCSAAPEAVSDTVSARLLRGTPGVLELATSYGPGRNKARSTSPRRGHRQLTNDTFALGRPYPQHRGLRPRPPISRPVPQGTPGELRTAAGAGLARPTTATRRRPPRGSSPTRSGLPRDPPLPHRRPHPPPPRTATLD